MKSIPVVPTAKLYSCSQLVQIDPGENSSLQEMIAFCARVSNPKNQNNEKTADRLIKYLIDHKHWSPFEMVNVCMEIYTTRDIARQLLRHRSFSFQEFSQRYANPMQDLAFHLREPRFQDPQNRQSSIELDNTPENARLEDEWYNMQIGVIQYAKMAYKWAIDNGIAKESARVVLPEGLTGSRLYVNGTIRSWIHFIEVRTDPTTQKEHRELARACAMEVSKVFPSINNFLPEETKQDAYSK